MLERTRTQRGISFIDVLVGSAILLLVFGGIIAGFRLSVVLLAVASGQQGALSIATDQIEHLRSLSYNDVGTVGGIPAGTIPQEETVTLNNITYTKRVLVQYVDAPEDGTDLSDENDITADYKRARVAVSWSNRGRTYEEVLVTNIVPQGIETIGGGGTLRIEVFDALVNPVADASIRIINASTSPAIDVSTFTNISGTSLFSGAPTSSGYQIIATKDGYSTDQTYSVTLSNPNPNPGHVTVLGSQTTSVSLSIDRLSALTVTTVEPVQHATTTDTFTDSTGIASMTATVVSSGSIALEDTGSGYSLTGEVRSTHIAPVYLDAWDRLSWNDTRPSGTAVTYRLYYDVGSGPVLVPDTALTGNAAGFTTSPVDLSGLNAGTYDDLYLHATLETNATTTTPTIDDWTIEYYEGPIPIPNVAFAIQGEKTIGTDGGGSPVYKYQTSTSTDSTGTRTLTNLEWDTYTFSIDGGSTGYDISEACEPFPLSLDPDTATTTELTLVSHTNNSLRVTVTNTAQDTLAGATVQLSGGGYDETRTTSACGQVFFGGVSPAGNYTLDTSLSGYTSDVQVVEVNGNDDIVVTLN